MHRRMNVTGWRNLQWLFHRLLLLLLHAQNHLRVLGVATDRIRAQVTVW